MSSNDPELLQQLRDLLATRPEDRPRWKPNTAFETLVCPDADLASIIGPDPISRSELGRKLWDYIRRHKLQDEGDGWTINVNETLAKITHGEESVTATELIRFVLRHIS